MTRIVLAISLVLFLAIAGLAQRFRFQDQEEEGPRPVFPSQSEFHFVRAEYTDLPEYHRFFGYASRGAGAKAGGWWIGRMRTTISPRESKD